MSGENEKKNSSAQIFFNGLIKENPTFVLTLGMCPTLAVTTGAINGLGMGLTTTVVLVLSNIIISILRNIIPAKVGIPAFIKDFSGRTLSESSANRIIERKRKVTRSAWTYSLGMRPVIMEQNS